MNDLIYINFSLIRPLFFLLFNIDGDRIFLLLHDRFVIENTFHYDISVEMRIFKRNKIGFVFHSFVTVIVMDFWDILIGS